jgi:hypothetical protein
MHERPMDGWLEPETRPLSVDVETEMTIDRGRAEVAAYATDPANAPEWYANIERAELETPRPLGSDLGCALPLASWVDGSPTPTASRSSFPTNVW